MITAFIPIIGKVLDSIFPDKEEAAKAKCKLDLMRGGLKVNMYNLTCEA